MSLNISDLLEMGAFTGAPVIRSIEWEQGGKTVNADVYVRPLSYLSAKSDLTSLNDGHDPIAGRIAACICDEAGKPVFTADDITGEADASRGPLNNNLTMALLQVIGEVNGLGKAQS